MVGLSEDDFQPSPTLRSIIASSVHRLDKCHAKRVIFSLSRLLSTHVKLAKLLYYWLTENDQMHHKYQIFIFIMTQSTANLITRSDIHRGEVAKLVIKLVLILSLIVFVDIQ